MERPQWMRVEERRGKRRVIFCGGRDFADYPFILRSVGRLLRDRGWRPADVRAVHGAAPGADTLAARACRALGIEAVPYPADWRRLGKAAGPARNREMLVKELPCLVVAFPGGRGTANMLELAKGRSVPIWMPE